MVDMDIQDYPNRFSPETQWQKVLFCPDRKSQAAELHELQSILNHQQTENFTFLYSVYSITKPISVTPTRLGPTTHQVKISAGQVYIRTPQGGYFIDTTETYLEVAPEGRTYIGLVPKFSIQSGTEDDLKDPITGGWFSGDAGADRYLLSYEYVVNGDAYPVAIVHGQGVATAPLVFYYENEGYSRNVSKEFLAPAIRQYLALHWYEESGDFIAQGLELSIEMGQYLTVAPGIAYILGNKIERLYSAHFSLPKIRRTTPTNTRYLIYLDLKGEVEIVATEAIGVSIPDASLLLGTIEIDSLYRRYYALSSKNRALLNADLKLLELTNQENEIKLMQLLLDRQMVDEGRERELDLSGVFTDVFAGLSKSDYHNQLYSAAIAPKQLSLRSGFRSSTINFSNVTVVSTNNAAVAYKDGNPYYLTSALSARSLITQARATRWLTLGTQEVTRAAMILNPPAGVPDSSTREFGVVSFSKIPALANREDARSSTGTIKLTLQSTVVNLECYGFRAYENNLVLSFGNIQITEFDLLNGTLVGSSFGSLKAKVDGTVFVRFRVPNNLEHKPYVVSLSNDRASASALFGALDTTSTALVSTTSTVQSAVAALGQTFQISTPLMVTGVKLAFRKAPDLSQVTAAFVSLTRTKLGLPTEEVIGSGALSLSSIQTSADGTKWTEVKFNTPVLLDQVGQYAITVSPLLTGAELFIAEVGQPNLSNANISSVQPLVGGELVVRKGLVWETVPAADLTFELIQGIPAAIKSEVIFQVPGAEEFHNVLASIAQQLPQGTTTQLFYKMAGDWVVFKNGNPLPTGTQLLDMKLELTSTSTISPLLDLSKTYILLQTNLKSSIWISKTVEFDFSYSTVEVNFNYYQPIGTTISVFASSNEGETWEALPLEGSARDSAQLVDGNVPLYRGVYRRDLGTIVQISDLNGNTSNILRKKLTIRIDFDTKDANAVPFIQRLATIVY